MTLKHAHVRDTNETQYAVFGNIRGSQTDAVVQHPDKINRVSTGLVLKSTGIYVLFFSFYFLLFYTKTTTQTLYTDSDGFYTSRAARVKNGLICRKIGSRLYIFFLHFLLTCRYTVYLIFSHGLR